jgi:hypothetical protein
VRLRRILGSKVSWNATANNGMQMKAEKEKSERRVSRCFCVAPMMDCIIRKRNPL